MTDIEMSLNHKDNDVQICIAKFESDKDSDGNTETPETDPLALDDDDKMEVETNKEQVDAKEENTTAKHKSESDFFVVDTQVIDNVKIVQNKLNTRNESLNSPPEKESDIQMKDLKIDCNIPSRNNELTLTKIVVKPDSEAKTSEGDDLNKNTDSPLKSALANGKTQNESLLGKKRSSTETKVVEPTKIENTEITAVNLSIIPKVSSISVENVVEKSKNESNLRIVLPTKELECSKISGQIQSPEDRGCLSIVKQEINEDEKHEENKRPPEPTLAPPKISNNEKQNHLTHLEETPLMSLKDITVTNTVLEHNDNIFKQDNCSSGDSDDEATLHIVEEAPAAPPEKINTEVTVKKENTICKRRLEDAEVNNEQGPSKKLCQELQESFEKHNSMLTDYISSTCNNTVEEIDRHTETLISEIEALKELAQNKEMEWNNVLHLKKVKEEILLRLIRKKKVMLLEKVNHDIAESKKNSTSKKSSNTIKNLVQDRYDEVNEFNLSKNAPNCSRLTTNHNLMSPITSLPYCPISMPNFAHLDKNINYYGNKKIVPKPIMTMIPNPRLPPAYQLSDRNGQLDSFCMPMGRQGPTKDVQSIIADYRQRHPEIVPRRGRRMKSLLNPQTPQIQVGPRPIAPHPDHSMDLGLLLGRMEGNPHMTVTEAITNQQNAMLGQQVATSLPNGMSFKDVLVQFANMTGQGQGGGGTSSTLPPPPPYPEVTLHPVLNSQGGNKAQQASHHSQHSQQQQTNSLLHGILTKSQPKQDSRFSTFSPTLARLLTAPEKVAPPTTIPISTSYIPQKNCMEITITPVPQGNQSTSRQEPEIVQLDDYEEAELEEDSADRPLVIDEGGRGGSDAGGGGTGTECGAVELSESEVPECQGCHRKEAQFVCAGCANQWYCSRECQVSAWDEHSEVCSG